jgi:hypothetical protein
MWKKKFRQRTHASALYAPQPRSRCSFHCAKVSIGRSINWLFRSAGAWRETKISTSFSHERRFVNNQKVRSTEKIMFKLQLFKDVDEFKRRNSVRTGLLLTFHLRRLTEASALSTTLCVIKRHARLSVDKCCNWALSQAASCDLALAPRR